MKIFVGSAYEKLCLAAKNDEIGSYISDRKYQTIHPGDKNSVPYIDYGSMLSAINQYLEKHPGVQQQFATTFLEEIVTSPHENALITLIEMLHELTHYHAKKGFFTNELVAEMANQIDLRADKLEAYHVDGLGYEYRREKLQFIDRYVYPLFGIHLVK